MKILPALCLILLGFPSLHALEFRVVSWAGPISGLYYEDGALPVEITGEEEFLSRPHALRSCPATLELFRQIERDGETIRQPATSIPLPENLTKGILVLAPANASGTAYAGLWIDDSPEARPPNHLQIHNLSSRLVAIKTTDGDFMLPARTSRQVAFDPQARSVPLRIAAQTDSAWELVSTRRQPVRRNTRVLVLLRDGRATMEQGGMAEARTLDVVTILDRAPVRLAGAAAP